MSFDERSSRSQTPDEVVHSRDVVEPAGAAPAAGAPVSPVTPVVAEQRVVRGASPLSMWVNVIYLVFAVVDGLIAIRFVLKLLAANPQAGFASFIYGVTAPLVAPFNGLLGNPSASAGYQLEVTSLVALLIYALIGWLLTRLALIFVNRSVSVSRREVR